MRSPDLWESIPQGRSECCRLGSVRRNQGRLRPFPDAGRICAKPLIYCMHAVSKQSEPNLYYSWGINTSILVDMPTWKKFLPVEPFF